MRNQQQQLSEAYTAHADQLFRFCFFKLNDQELAKDLLQEAFMKAWRYIAEGHTVNNLKPFLYQIVGNLVIDEYRRRKSNESLEELYEEGFDVAFDDTGRWMDTIDGRKAVQLLKKIPSPYGEALFMRYVQELSLAEISEISKESENAIAVRIHRGLEKLRSLYYEHQSK